MQTVFVTAASGNIGTILIPRLLRQTDVRLILATTQASKLAHFKDNTNVSIIEGALSDPQWVEKHLVDHQVNTVFLNLWGTDELFTVFNMLDAIQRAAIVKHVVYVSACGDFLGDPDHVIDWMSPHTKIKPPVERALQNIQVFTHTVIGPSLFFENDRKVKAAIMHGRRWVEPYGEKGASRVAVADVALAAEIAILDRGTKWGGKKIMLGTLKKYTGEECAEIWGGVLGFKVTPVPSDRESLDKLEAHLRQQLGAVWGRDLRLLYEGIIKTGFGMTQREYDTEVAFLGREPASYEDFVKQEGLEWKQSFTKKPAQ